MRSFDPRVWFQISRKFRLVAKFPEGTTGMQALAKHSEDAAWIEGMGDMHAGELYLRCYATEKVELTRDEWAAYFESGGGTYINKFYPLRKR